jgi:Uma2 family endonuclease
MPAAGILDRSDRKSRPMETLEQPRIKRHLLNVDQYHRMAEAGVFEAGARIELIEGEVIDMAPIGSRHWSAVSRLNRLLVLAAGDRAVVSVQSSLRLHRRTELEPDLTLLKAREDFYASALPTGADVLLVIEVADSSLAIDMRTKLRLYAKHGVPEYWVVDLPTGLLHTFGAPQGEAYTRAHRIAAPGVIALPGLDGVTVDLAGLL